VWQEPEEQAAPEDEPQKLPELVVGEALDLLRLIPKQFFTQPPPRYTEAALIKALEERGIGRPSTFAGMVATIKAREYAAVDKRCLYPTPLGELTCDALVAAFPAVMDYGFTAQVEDWLDDISRGEREWVAVLREFYGPFAQALEAAKVTIKQVRRAADAPPVKRTRKKQAAAAPVVMEPDSVCPLCGAAMVRRTSRYGTFLGCSKFPACRGTRKLTTTGQPKT
jgi:DNA topoisomerase-1